MPEADARIPGWGGGVNLAAAQDQLKEDEALGLLNMVLDENGGGSKRLGSSSVSDPGARIISIHPFYRGTAAPQVLVHLADGRFRYSNDNGFTWTTAVTGMSTVNPMAWETFNNKVYMVNGVDAYQSWDGTTAAAHAGAPVGKFLKVWKDTMWVAGADADRVYSSDPGNAEVFTAGNWVDLGRGDGDTIMGLATDGNVLIAPKRKRGFLIFDPTTFANRMYDPDKGCESHFSFIHFDQNLFYLSREGVCVYLGDSPSQLISGNIDPIFTPDVLNFDKMPLAWAYVVNNRIGWTVPETGSALASLQIEMLPRSEKRPFTFHRGPWGCFATLRTASVEVLLAGKTTSNKLLIAFDGGDDDGVPYAGMIETKWFNFENPLIRKYLRRMLLTGRGKFFMGILLDYQAAVKKSRNLDLAEFQAQWNEPGDLWNDETWGPSAILETKPIHPDVYGRAFKFRFTDSLSGEGIQTIDVGDVDYKIARGQWALYGGIMHVSVMGTDP